MLRLFTRAGGVRSALARGAKRDKSAFGGPLDLFYLGEAVLLVRPRSTLDLLTSFGVRDSFPGLRKSLPRFYGACHLAEILVGMTREGEAHGDLFDLYRDALGILASTPPDRVAPVLLAAELGALRDLGFAPTLARCAACGGDVPPGPAHVSASLGGTLCDGCRDRDAARRPIGPGVRETLRHLASAAPAAALRVRLPAAAVREARDFLDAFEEWRLERPLRAARFLR